MLTEIILLLYFYTPTEIILLFFFLEIILLKLAYETGFSKSFFSWYKGQKKIVKHNRNIF